MRLQMATTLTDDEWVQVAHKVKGACLGLEEDGFELFADWAEEWSDIDDDDDSWRSLPKVPRTGWPELARWVERRSNGAFRVPPSEFDDEDGGDDEDESDNDGDHIADRDEEDEGDAEGVGEGDPQRARAAALDKMFATQVWVENQERVLDLRDQATPKSAAVQRPLRQDDQKGRPALGRLHGRTRQARRPFIQLARAPRPSLTSPIGLARRCSSAKATRASGQPLARGGRHPPASRSVMRTVRPWLDHVALIIPDPILRDLFLDWLASIVQRLAREAEPWRGNRRQARHQQVHAD